MRELLSIEPVSKEAIWGGSRPKEVYNYDIPSGHTGECWTTSTRRSDDCKVASGTYAGRTLSSLWEKQRELSGKTADFCKEFPFFVKIIDAKEDLSIQVHPDNIYAAKHENGSLGKMECWHILDCDKDGTVIIGHHAKDRGELTQMVGGGRRNEFIRQVPVKRGDFFQIDPRCVHTIKGGTLILETQQNSDITYRVYDYDRLSNGKPRRLHVEQNIDVIRAPFAENRDQQPVLTVGTNDDKKYRLVTCARYTTDKAKVTGHWEEDFGNSFANVSILEGEGTVDGITAVRGNHFIVPTGYRTVEFKDRITFISPQAVQEVITRMRKQIVFLDKVR